jgi:hypothetical protein
MKKIKTVKWCFCMILWLTVNHARPQVFSAPILEFLTETQTAETIASLTEQIQNMLKILDGVRKGIDIAKSTRDTLQKIYNQNKEAYDKLKHVVGGIKDFEVNGVSYFAERVLERSLNPGDYMLNIDNKEYNKFKKSISYDPGSDISSRAKYSFDYLAKLNPSMAWGDLTNWKIATFKRNIEKDIASSEAIHKTDSLAIVLMNRALDTALVMGDGERLQLLLQAQKILMDNDALRKDEMSSIEEMLNRKIIEEAIIEKKRNHVNSIYAFQNVVTKRWRHNKGFSLTKYAKARGKKAKPVIIDTGVQFKRY